MTDTELSLLKSSIDQIVELELTAGERHLSQILFVFDEGDTPDVFSSKSNLDPMVPSYRREAADLPCLSPTLLPFIPYRPRANQLSYSAYILTTNRRILTQ